MCPMVFIAMFFTLILMLLELTAALNVTFHNKAVTLKEGEQELVGFTVYDDTKPLFDPSNSDLYAYTQHNDIANVNAFNISLRDDPNQNWFNGTFSVKGNFLGYTEVRLVRNYRNGTEEKSDGLLISVLRKKTAIQTAFIFSVAIIVSLNYINMGCALDLSVVKAVLVKPIAPIVGFVCQFIVMPLAAFGAGKALFSQPILQLGLFVFGCSPGGGASNMWTVLLGGNLNLSITMTFISTIAALGMIPFWLFTLGSILFKGASSKVPFQNVVTTLVAMVVPLGIGLLFQRYLPKVAKICRRILVPVSIAMILFIIGFGIYANLYMFRLFSWQIVVAATINVWVGFLSGAFVSKVFRLPMPDILAIAIETAVQNTGISIALLGFSLDPLDSDLASVVPVAGSIVTPLPMIVVWVIQKIYTCATGNGKVPEHPIDRYVTDDDEARQMVLSTSDGSFTKNGAISNGHI